MPLRQIGRHECRAAESRLDGLPGLPDPAQVRDWLATGENAPAHSFGERYPAPSFVASKLAPA
ncbi:hypothetical protein [Kibdelosporangium philippinense]|uniref:hypothetical protein n=1 Tax=Kibdelosporangium philippinense TaxID=211113 RepID=UPI0036081EEE